MPKFHCLALAVLAATALPVLAQSVPADLILHNGKIVTLDKRSSLAQAVALPAGKFVAPPGGPDPRRQVPRRRQRRRGEAILRPLDQGHRPWRPHGRPGPERLAYA